MTINSCTSCSSSNLANYYAEQWANRSRGRLPSGIEANKAMQPVQQEGFKRTSGATVNILGEVVGALINTSA